MPLKALSLQRRRSDNWFRQHSLRRREEGESQGRSDKYGEGRNATDADASTGLPPCCEVAGSCPVIA